MGCIDPQKSACIGWNYDQLYEILGGHLIDPTIFGRIGHPRNTCNEWNYDQCMRYWEDIWLTQLLVGRTLHPKNACNEWNFDQIDEVQGEHLIDPSPCGMHRASQECL